MREGFVFYRGFADALSDLEPEDRLACYDAICKYALDGTVPELKGVPSAIFKMARPQIDANNQKYENGKKGGRPKTEAEPTENQTITKPKPNDNQTETEPEPKEKEKEKVKVKDKKERDTIVSPKKSSRFSAPSVDQVKEYCSERGNGIDAQSFVDFYQRQNWRLSNGVKMSDWKAAVRTWEKRRNDKNTYNNHPEQRKEYGGEIAWTGL